MEGQPAPSQARGAGALSSPKIFLRRDKGKYIFPQRDEKISMYPLKADTYHQKSLPGHCLDRLF